MVFCVLKGCFSHSSRNTNKESGVTFHRFLRPIHEKREAWIQFVQKNRNEETWLPNQDTRICSLHFKQEDKYTTKGGKLYLKKSAVPCDFKNTVQPGPSKPEQLEISDQISEPISAPVSDSESIFDSPRTISLKEKLLKETTARANLQKKYKALQRQNRHLKKKCLSYKNMVTTLKKKFNSDCNTKSDLMAKN